MQVGAQRAALAAAVLLLALGAVWWLAGRRGHDDTTTAVAPDSAVAPTERERVRAEIEALRAAEAAGQAGAGPTTLARLTDGSFSHAQHRELPCTQCHDVTASHGSLTVTGLGQCRDCHHTAPLSANCAACHEAADFTGERRAIAQQFRTSVAEPTTRDLLFAHAQHRSMQCTECHQQPQTMAVTSTCADCHEQHHQPEMQCMACHTVPPRAAHTVQAHVGCTASGCHDTGGVAGVPRTRPFCLVCHQELVDHERGRNCADCHRLPPPTTAAAAAWRPPGAAR